MPREREHAYQIALPAHLLMLVDAKKTVDAVLERLHDGREETPLAVHHARHERAQRNADRDQDGEVQRALNGRAHLVITPQENIDVIR